MLTVSIAKSPADFDAAAVLCGELADWDVTTVQAYGVDPRVVMALYHGETAESLSARYTGADASMFLAAWNGSPAGCLAYSSFDEGSDELHRFYVAPAFRRQGIGRALMQSVITGVEQRRKTRLLAHTTVYMTDAISMYRSFGLDRCEAFRDVPDSVRHTEIFLSRML